jgi:hypothetical protein
MCWARQAWLARRYSILRRRLPHKAAGVACVWLAGNVTQIVHGIGSGGNNAAMMHRRSAFFQDGAGSTAYSGKLSSTHCTAHRRRRCRKTAT